MSAKLVAELGFFMSSRKTRSLYPKQIGYAWDSIKYRCFNKKGPDYKNYGGRGIRVCERWLKFENFAEDMFPTFKEGLTLDRIDVNGNYCKENCRWIGWREQQENRRNTRKFAFQGKYMTLPRWSEHLGIKRSTLEMRIYAYGWSIEKALTEKPKNANRKYITTSE